MIRELLWRAVARIVTIPAVTWWLKARSERTPYKHIRSTDGSLYMGRWWLFNAYPADDGPDTRSWLRKRLPSARIHYICRPDSDRHMHDHAWNARTIILRGWYVEERPTSLSDTERTVHCRDRGYTGQLLFGEFHRISHVQSDGGAWTLFITWKKQGTWGFLVDGQKVPWRKYLEIHHGS